MNIEENCIVSVYYTLTNKDGEVLDSPEGRPPLVYLHGAHNIITGLENALTGKKAGDHFQVVVQPEEGYGEAKQELIQVIPHKAFGQLDKLEAGMEIQAQTNDGRKTNLIIRGVSEDGVTVDANHPLAGVVLHFDVQVEEVRHASKEELSQNYVH